MAHLLDVSECRQRYIEESTDEILAKLDEFKKRCYLELGGDFPNTLEELLTDINLKILRIRRYSLDTSAAIIAYSETKKQKRREKRQRYSKNRRNMRHLTKQFMELSLTYKGLSNCQPKQNYFSTSHNASNE